MRPNDPYPLPFSPLSQGGSETGRVPAILSGKVQKFLFKEDELVNVFDLNNLYAECRKDKKYAAKIKEQEEEEKESKKDK